MFVESQDSDANKPRIMYIKTNVNPVKKASNTQATRSKNTSRLYLFEIVAQTPINLEVALCSGGLKINISSFLKFKEMLSTHRDAIPIFKYEFPEVLFGEVVPFAIKPSSFNCIKGERSRIFGLFNSDRSRLGEFVGFH
jgi:hypothetical protein